MSKKEREDIAIETINNAGRTIFQKAKPQLHFIAGTVRAHNIQWLQDGIKGGIVEARPGSN